MRNFLRYFSDKFLFEDKKAIDFKSETIERQKTIDKMTEEGILEKPKDGKRYAIHKANMMIYEIVCEKEGFFRVKDNEGNLMWEEKEVFYADNIVYNTKADFINKEKEKLLSKIDTSRYDVYTPIQIHPFMGEPTVGMIEAQEKENAESLMKFIKAHTTADFRNRGCIFSNYILIGY